MSSKTVPTQPAAKYLPFKNAHVVIIKDLTALGLKKSAEEFQKDREEISHNTVLNHIAKSLGFERGFAGFRETGEEALAEFMAKHELRKQANLLTPRETFGCAVWLGARQLADRLFNRDKVCPRRVFTGYNCPWSDINQRWHRQNPLSNKANASLNFELTHSELARARASFPQEVSVLLEAAVAELHVHLRAQSNLLDDMLVHYEEAGEIDLARIEPKLYWQPDADPNDKERGLIELRQAAGLFREWMCLRSDGWVDLLRFNDRLIFLRGQEGEFDFIFEGLRDEPFKKNPFSPYLRSGDIPKSNDTHHFERWLYFQHKGHLESEIHQAEASFYARGGKSLSHPGETEMLRAHLIASGSYHPPRKEKSCAPGYTTVLLGKEGFNVSDLISIGQFNEFLKSDPSYLEHRRKCPDLEDLAGVNLDNPDSLPVAVTWYDANAYAAWISRNKGLPVKLLRESEYTLLRSTLDVSKLLPLSNGEIPWRQWPELMEQNGASFAPVLNIGDDSLVMKVFGDFADLNPSLSDRYRHESLVWGENHEGLRFLLSPFFGEWLDHEGVAANSAYGSSLCSGHVSPLGGKFTPKSTGRYKGMKVGFRLCYRNGAGGRIEEKLA